MEYFGNLISFPPIQTNYFNPDGMDIFRSKIQIILLVPTVIIFFIMAIGESTLIFEDWYVRSDYYLSTEKGIFCHQHVLFPYNNTIDNV